MTGLIIALQEMASREVANLTKEWREGSTYMLENRAVFNRMAGVCRVLFPIVLLKGAAVVILLQVASLASASHFMCRPVKRERAHLVQRYRCHTPSR